MEKFLDIKDPEKINHWIQNCNKIVIEILILLVPINQLKEEILKVQENVQKHEPYQGFLSDLLLTREQQKIVNHLDDPQYKHIFEFLREFDVSITIKIIKSFKFYFEKNSSWDFSSEFQKYSNSNNELWGVINDILYVRNKYYHLGPIEYNKRAVRNLLIKLNKDIFKFYLVKTFPKFEKFVKEFRVYYELPAQQETKQIMQASSSDITSFNFVTSTSVLHKGHDSGKETVHPANISLPLHTEDNGESTEHMVEDIDMKTGSAEEETVEYINEKEKVCFQSGSAGNLQSDQKTNPKGQQNVIKENSIPKLPIINIVQKIIETCTVPEGDNFEKSTCLKLLESVEGSDINEVLGQVLVKATNENIENILQFVLLDLSVEKLITFETAFQILLEKIEYLDEIIKLRSKIANIVAIGFRNHIISIDVLITAFYVKLHHPLFLLCLSAIEKKIGKDKLKQIVKDKIDWTKMLPSCSAKTPQLIYETLKDKNLEYLVENVIVSVT